jgi:starch-binding outer membrane protein, SusD/RagB family
MDNQYNLNKSAIAQSWLCYAFPLLFLLVFNQSCKKLVEVKPPSTSINSGNVFANDKTAIAAVTDIYVKMSGQELPGGGIASLSLFPGLSSDELSLYNGATNNSVNFYYTNTLTSTNLTGTDFWFPLYQTIYVTNAAIEELSKSTGLTLAVRIQLEGEVKFIRAFCYFYLVNLYGDVPLALTTNYQANAVLSRANKSAVYDRIISDLTEAQNLLSSNFLNATLLNTTTDRVRPTRWAATALLARAYLYKGEYIKAENEASTIINNSSLFGLPTLNNVFLKNSSEAIWQLQPVHAGWNTEDAKIFILSSNGPDQGVRPFYLSPQLINSFDAADQRKTNWVKTVTVGSNTYYYPYKYKSATFNDPVTEYKMVLRLSEQYLIRAEARAMQNRISDARDDLNIIKSRASLGNSMANDQASLLTAILKEKQVELFTEWGHRWFDLKRTKKVDAVMSIVTPQKGGTWNSNWQWYPITRNELNLNPNLVQNGGY